MVKIASGPPSGTTYRDDNEYIGGELVGAACLAMVSSNPSVKELDRLTFIVFLHRILSVGWFLQIHDQRQIQGRYEQWKRRQLRRLRRRDEKVWLA